MIRQVLAGSLIGVALLDVVRRIVREELGRTWGLAGDGLLFGIGAGLLVPGSTPERAAAAILLGLGGLLLGVKWSLEDALFFRRHDDPDHDRS